MVLAEANEVYTRKLEEFTEKANSNQKMRQMVKALNSVSETVKLMLEFISESSERKSFHSFIVFLIRFTHKTISLFSSE